MKQREILRIVWWMSVIAFFVWSFANDMKMLTFFALLFWLIIFLLLDFETLRK